jgi:hypothetical protein
MKLIIAPMLISLPSIFVLAQAQAPPDWIHALLQGSSAGAVLAPIVVWGCVRLERILERLREAMERNTNSLMISVLNTRHLDDALRPLAEKLANESAASMKQ